MNNQLDGVINIFRQLNAMDCAADLSAAVVSSLRLGLGHSQLLIAEIITPKKNTLNKQKKPAESQGAVVKLLIKEAIFPKIKAIK